MSILDAKPNKAPASAFRELSKEQRASIAMRYPLRMKAESNAFSVSETRYPGVGSLVSQKLAAEQASGKAGADLTAPDTTALGRSVVGAETSLPAHPNSVTETAAAHPVSVPVESARAPQASPIAPEQPQSPSPAHASVQSAPAGETPLDLEAIRARIDAVTQGQMAA